MHCSPTLAGPQARGLQRYISIQRRGRDIELMHNDRGSQPVRVAIVAPTMGILGGQAVQADRLLRAWQGDPDVYAWLVPINPIPPGAFRRAMDIKYVRTIATQFCYWPQLFRELRRADVGRAVPTVGADDRLTAGDPAVHPRTAAVLGGARFASDAAAPPRRA